MGERWALGRVVVVVDDDDDIGGKVWLVALLLMI